MGTIRDDGSSKNLDEELLRLPDVREMSERELLEENVANTRELVRFAAEIAAGMDDFYSKFKNNPIARFFGG
jgi:hypothetical protein